jgi:hypothetical protein
MDTNPFHFWKKDGMIPGFIEGLENYLLVIRPFYSYPHLAYGAGG